MKWLLITTICKNVGDDFARIGVQNLIREIDPQAQFELLCKESEGIHKPRPFDRAVLCGMPLFWSIYSNECQEIDWWKPIIRGWVSQTKRNFAVIGAGHVFVNEIFNFRRYCEAIEEVISRAHVVTTREPVMDHPKIVEGVCPAAFATTPDPVVGGLKLCNLMPAGGHHFCLKTQDREIQTWNAVLPGVAKWLRDEGFSFVSHDGTERDLAMRLGWKENEIKFFGAPEYYLDLYRQASVYFGNRLHGAVVSASVGAKTLAIAADSRIRMVHRVGGQAYYPSQFTLDMIGKPGPVVDLPAERAKLKKILWEFAA